MVQLIELLASDRKLTNIDLSWNNIWESENTMIDYKVEEERIYK